MSGSFLDHPPGEAGATGQGQSHSSSSSRILSKRNALAFRLVLSTFALREPALAQYFLLTGLDVMDALAVTATARLHFCHRRERITARGRSKDIERGILVGLPMQSASGVLLFAVEGFTITRKPSRTACACANDCGKYQSSRRSHSQRAILGAWRRGDCCPQGRVSAKRKSGLLCSECERSLSLGCGIPGSLG
jgi:hypothetical protein